MILLLLILSLLPGSGDDSAQAPPSLPAAGLVQLSAQASHRGPGGGQDKLDFVVRVTNNLESDLGAVEVGIIYAQEEEHLKGLDPSLLYSGHEQVRKMGKLLVVKERLVTRVPAGEVREAGVSVALSAAGASGDSVPRVFLTHLLGFHLAEVTAKQLSSLVLIGGAAGEWAVCEALGGTPGGRARKAAREKLREDPDFIPIVREVLLKALVSGGSGQSFRMGVFAVLALGVHGGPDAEKVLADLVGNPVINSFDEGIQVLRLARLRNNSYEVPLAFAFPSSLVRAEELVVHALGMCRDSFSEVEVEERPSVVPLADSPGEEKKGAENEDSILRGVGGVFLLGILCVLFWQLKRRVRRD